MLKLVALSANHDQLVEEESRLCLCLYTVSILLSCLDYQRFNQFSLVCGAVTWQIVAPVGWGEKRRCPMQFTHSSLATRTCTRMKPLPPGMTYSFSVNNATSISLRIMNLSWDILPPHITIPSSPVSTVQDQSTITSIIRRESIFIGVLTQK
jgi:hypothetical protein